MRERIINLLLFYPVFLFSLSVHEAAHGWMAEKFGDRTARLLGRVSINPFPHLDPIGTVLLPIVGILTGAPIIGWGKPVPVDTRYFRKPRQDNIWVAVAGPISNAFLVVAFVLIFWLLVWVAPQLPPQALAVGSFSKTVFEGALAICQMGVLLNLMLGAFNLLPVPPLDGSNILRGVLPERMLPAFDDFARYGFFILLALFVTGALRFLFVPVYAIASRLLS